MFYFSEFGTSRTVKKKGNNGLETLDLVTNDGLDSSTRRTDTQCVGMYVLPSARSLDRVDLQELCCCFVGLGG